ncbi:MAG: TonB family protein [Sandaracinaceae bacterium]|nr:TonB family protein [Sandaracinaceae bacterium]
MTTGNQPPNQPGNQPAGAAPAGAPRGRPGAMTMAMQAVQVGPQAGPKVLRIGVIQGGKIVEERIIRKRETVRIGNAESNTFVVSATGIPTKFDLFQLVGNDYILNFTEAMKGRVSLPAGVQQLDQLRTSGAARNAGTHWQVKLNDSSRGKVSIGDVTFLFQFVSTPPVQPRPQLPAAARGGFVKGIDWTYTAFIMFSFMVHFGFIIYLENADWKMESDLNQIPDEIARMIFEEPPPPEEEEAPPEQQADNTPAPTKAPERPQNTPAPQQQQQQQAAPAQQAEQTARIAEQAAAQAEQMLLGALGDATDSAINDVLRGGAITGDAASVLDQAAGVGVATGASGSTLRQRGGGGDGSGEGAGLGGLAAAGGAGATAAQGEGAAVAEVRVRGRTQVEDGDAIGGDGDFDQSNVVRMIRTRISAIRACYEQQLRRNPALEGKVTVEFTIQTTGSVSGAHATENTTNDPAVATCVVSTVSRFRFNPGPEGGSVVFSYPFVFAPQT